MGCELTMLTHHFDSEYKDESDMILLDISMSSYSLNRVLVSEMIASVFFAGRAAAGGSWGSVPAPEGGGYQLQYGGVQLQKLLQEEESCSWWDSLGSVQLQ